MEHINTKGTIVIKFVATIKVYLEPKIKKINKKGKKVANPLYNSY